jgi:hypothetical protein
VDHRTFNYLAPGLFGATLAEAKRP